MLLLSGSERTTRVTAAYMRAKTATQRPSLRRERRCLPDEIGVSSPCGHLRFARYQSSTSAAVWGRHATVPTF